MQIDFENIKKNIDQEILKFLDTEILKFSSEVQHALRYVLLQDSKRFRSLLFVVSFLSFGGNLQDRPSIYKFAVNFELLHNFVLIHDDIIDKSPKRRGKDSLHAKEGENFAILFGDLLYTIALNRILELDTTGKSLNIILDSGIRTAEGAIDELFQQNFETKDKILQIYSNKTSYYSFVAPLCIGYYFAKKIPDRCIIQRLKLYSKYLGLAYQIQDDIEDVSDYKTFMKLNDFKMNLWLFLLYQKDQTLREKVDKEILFKEIQKYNILDSLKAYIDELKKRANVLEQQIPIPNIFKMLINCS